MAEIETMNIDEALNGIIFKYNLDKHYPHYRNKCGAEKVLKDIIDEIVQNNIKALFVGNDRTGIEFIRNMVVDYDDIHFLFYKRDGRQFYGLEETNWSEYDKVYLISFYDSEHAERWFRLHNVKYEWIYDIFETGGVYTAKRILRFGEGGYFFFNQRG